MKLFSDEKVKQGVVRCLKMREKSTGYDGFFYELRRKWILFLETNEFVLVATDKFLRDSGKVGKYVGWL